MGFYVCNPLILYIWIDIIFYSLCYDQLVNTKRTVVESSSTYVSRSYSGSANKTIDRKFNQTYTNCMHTAESGSQAWLKLDLGDIFNLKSVKIWYRNDRGNISTRRLKGFSIFASDNSEPDENDKCYQESGNETLKTILEVNCYRTAQFVKIFTDKINEGYWPILEICEVEIFGCPRKKYGNMCLSCDMCKQDCDITGRCNAAGCLHDGYNPPFCKDCRYGKYGINCNFTCGHCIGNRTCNTTNGHCTLYDQNEICEPGWKRSWKCDEDCDDGTFGSNCGGNCTGHCSGGLPCNKNDGLCTEGCADGWKGPSCNISCSHYFYGDLCSLKCGNCSDGRTCHHVSGKCTNGCDAGVYGDKCKTPCPVGWHGENCSRMCGNCNTCDRFTGTCTSPCKRGWEGLYCRQACSPGRYGKDCKEQCGHCERNEPCHHVSGSCPALCEPGYNGEKCFTVCTNGWYGKDCKEQCGYCRGNKPCHHVNGSCFGFCEPEYSGEKCEDSVSSQVSQVLANQMEMLKLMKELISYQRRKIELKENGASPTDFK